MSDEDVVPKLDGFPKRLCIAHPRHRDALDFSIGLTRFKCVNGLLRIHPSTIEGLQV